MAAGKNPASVIPCSSCQINASESFTTGSKIRPYQKCTSSKKTSIVLYDTLKGHNNAL